MKRIHDISLFCLLLFYAIATVFQLHHGSDMTYEVGWKKSEPTFLLTQRIFNLPHHTYMVWEELVFDDAISFTVWEGIAAHLNVIAVTGIHTPVPRVAYPML